MTIRGLGYAHSVLFHKKYKNSNKKQKFPTNGKTMMVGRKKKENRIPRRWTSKIKELTLALCV